MRGEWKCIDLECTHYDGDRCTLGFCEPDTELDATLYEQYLKWDAENWDKFEETILFRDWINGGLSEE